jgi:hypothetical protein
VTSCGSTPHGSARANEGLPQLPAANDDMVGRGLGRRNAFERAGEIFDGDRGDVIAAGDAVDPFRTTFLRSVGILVPRSYDTFTASHIACASSGFAMSLCAPEAPEPSLMTRVRSRLYVLRFEVMLVGRVADGEIVQRKSGPLDAECAKASILGNCPAGKSTCSAIPAAIG